MDSIEKSEPTSDCKVNLTLENEKEGSAEILEISMEKEENKIGQNKTVISTDNLEIQVKNNECIDNFSNTNQQKLCTDTKNAKLCKEGIEEPIKNQVFNVNDISRNENIKAETIENCLDQEKKCEIDENESKKDLSIIPKKINANVPADKMEKIQDGNKQSFYESSSNDEEYIKNISYEENGTAIYTDPNTNVKYKFSETENNWVPFEQEIDEQNPYENEHYRWCFETNQWIPKTQSNVEYSFVDGLHTYKDGDGTIFFYDENKKAWFPKIDDDFMAIYQLNYGFDKDGNQKRKIVDDDGFKIPISIKEDIAEKIQIKKTDKEKEVIEQTTHNKKRKVQEPPKWFDIAPEQNTKVYVSNLPLDITEQEFLNLMSKCGLIMKDQVTQKFKIKLYSDSNGILKGDGLCDYIKVESVNLALKILDGCDVRGKQIKVQRAKFEMRGEYNPALKPKKKKKDKEKLAKLKERLLDWRPDKMRGERSKHERVVIIKNLFDPEIFNEKVELILEYQNDLREECSKCGNVRKVIIYDRHPDGVVSISMSCPEEADVVVQVMNRRFYGKRRLLAEVWDGKTKYKIDETTIEAQSRLSKWNNFLHDEVNNKSNENMKNEKGGELVGKCEINNSSSLEVKSITPQTNENIET